MSTSFVGVGILLLLIIVVVPLAGGVLLIVFSRRRGADHPACGKCGYNVHASIGSVTRCPECGADFGQAGITPPRGNRKRNPFMIGAGVALIVLPLGCFGSTLLFARAATVQATGARRAATAQQAAAAAQEEELTTETPSTQSGTEEGKD